MAGGRAVERRIVTVLFADLVGFTSLSESLDAEDVALVQDAYFDAVRDTVGRHGGQLEKFIGDAAMAVFGAPRTRDDDAERAVRAGLALVSAVERLGATLGLDERALRIRVGVNSGETLYGEASAERGPVTGDVVNVAARLQAAAEPGSVVVGELTALAVADAVELVGLEPLQLKGKADPVRAARVAGLYPERSRDRALGSLRASTLGRDEELELLDRAIGDGARTIVVVAPPGIGKSRLLTELELRARARGAVVLRARVRPDALGPYEAVGQLVQAAGGPERVGSVPGALPAGRDAALRRALELLGSETDPAEVEGERREREALFADWLEALDHLVGACPSVWLVEDVHWGSADLVAFLDAACRTPRAAGRLVVATARPSFLEEAGASTAADVLELPPLPEQLAGELVRALVGDAVPDPLLGRIVAVADGNPLFVEELLRMWADVGVLRHDAAGWTLAAEPAAVPLPPTVQAIYAAQLDDLPDAARGAARRAAVAGRRFPRSACGPLGIADADEAIATLDRRGLVRGPDEDELFGPSYAYRHALLRDAGYASLSKAERSALHRRLADWMTELPGTSVAALAEVIGRHYAAAAEATPVLARAVDGRTPDDLRAEAAAWFERASVSALHLAAWESARELAARALELGVGTGPVRRGRRLELLAEATANTEGADPAIELLEEALGELRSALAFEPAAARTGLASAGFALGNLLRAQTWFVAARDLADTLLEEIGPEAEPRSRARLLTLRATAILNATDDYDAAERDARRALELVRSAGDASFELDVEDVLAEIAMERGGYGASEASWRRIEELGRAQRRWSSVADSLRTRGAIRVDEDPGAALELFDRSADVCAEHGLVEGAAWCDHGRAEAHFAAGDWTHALAAGLRAVDAGERHAYLRVVVRSWFVLLPIARCLGRRDLIEQAFARFEARRGREPDSPYARIVTTAAHLDFAEIGLEPPFVPRVDERLASFDGAHGGPSWLAAIERVAGAWLDAGELDGTEAALDRMARYGSTTLALATEAIVRSRLQRLRADPDTAAAEARRALGLLGDRAPWWRLLAIGALEDVGAADAALRAEASSIEQRLGLRT